jgi:hypothetical protein
MTQPHKKPRQRTELPTELSDGTVIADKSIEDLIAMRDDHQKLLADVPRIELELRAIRAEIRRKA